MKNALLFTALLVLVSCGVDGAPKAPADAAMTPGVSVSGDVGMGVAGSL